MGAFGVGGRGVCEERERDLGRWGAGVRDREEGSSERRAGGGDCARVR